MIAHFVGDRAFFKIRTADNNRPALRIDTDEFAGTRLHALAASGAPAVIDGVLRPDQIEAVTAVVALQLLKFNAGVNGYELGRQDLRAQAVHPAHVALSAMDQAFAGKVLDPSAERSPLLQNSDADASIGQFRRAGQPGRASADHDHFWNGPTSCDDVKKRPGDEAGRCGPERESIIGLPQLARY